MMVATAYANGWVSQRLHGWHVPSEPDHHARAEAVSILNRVLGRSCDLTFVQANAQTALHFTDVPANAWYYADVIEASVGHTYTGWPASSADGARLNPSQQTPGTFAPGVFRLYRRPCMKPSMAVA